MSAKQAKWITLVAAVFISGLVFLFLPSEIYLRNTLEFTAAPRLLLKSLLPAALLLAGCLALPGVIPVRGWQRFYAMVIGGAAIAFWVSSVFLVPDFGSLDGAGFDLDLHTRTLNVHTGWFLLALAVACLGVWKWPTYIMRGLIVLGIGLVAISVNNFLAAGNQQDSLFEPVNPREIARFSKDQNLLILVLDTFQSDILNAIIEQDSGMGNKLDGFLFFPDTMGVAPTTYLTMPAFHSGVVYDRLSSLPEFYDRGIRQDSFLAELAGNGYQVDIVNPIGGVCPEGTNTCKNQENLLLQEQDLVDMESSRLADLGIFRLMPGLTKPWVFDGTNGVYSRIHKENLLVGLEQRIFQGNSVLQIVADELWVDDGAPAAKLIHLLNTHPPFMFDAVCEFIGVTNVIDRSHQTEQSKCAMRWFDYLMESMRAAGVYDNTMIILTADTGAGSIYADDDLSSLYAQKHGLEPGEMGRLIGGANPVLAIKYPGARGEMQVSPVQAQLTDIPTTVCTTLAGCSNTHGLDLRSGKQTVRERIYQYYQWKHEYWGLKSIPGIEQYSVSGPLWLESSWSRSTSGETPDEILTINFSPDDDPGIFGKGWGEIEFESEDISKRWSTAKRSTLYLPLPRQKAIAFSIRLYNPPGHIDQEISLIVDGHVIDSRELTEGLHEFILKLPGKYITKTVTEVVLGFNAIKSPGNEDQRELTAAFFKLVVYQL